MLIQRKWSFGLGTIFSLIVVYFIFLYSRSKGWVFLAFISKWYLIITGSLIALYFGIILLMVLVPLLLFLISMLKLRKIHKKHRKQKHKDYIDVDYKIKE